MSRPAVRGRLSKRADLLIGLAGLLALLVLWLVLTLGHLVGRVFLPTPLGVWEGAVFFHQKQWLFPAIGRSFTRVLVALFLVVGLGVPIGILMGAFAPVDAFLRKLVNGAKSIPTTGIVGLIVLWFGIEGRAKIAFLFLGSFFYMVILVKNAIANVSEDYLRVAVDLGATPGQIVTKVLIWGAMPQIWEAIAVCNGIMWTYIVLAEYVNASQNELGLGYLLSVGSRGNEAGQTFAALAIIALVSVMTDFILQALRKRFFYW